MDGDRIRDTGAVVSFFGGRHWASCLALRPTPICPIPPGIVGRVFPAAGPAVGEVYATYSFVDGRVWDHILTAALEAPYSLVGDTAPLQYRSAKMPSPHQLGPLHAEPWGSEWHAG